MALLATNDHADLRMSAPTQRALFCNAGRLHAMQDQPMARRCRVWPGPGVRALAWCWVIDFMVVSSVACVLCPNEGETEGGWV